MHVALIIDQERLEREQSMLNRLCIGLMAEGIQLTRIIPESFDATTVDEGEQRIALATRIEAPMRVLPWMRQARVNRLNEALVKSMPDVFYAVGHGAWGLGIDLSQALERPVLLDVHSIPLVESVPRSGTHGQALVGGYVAPCAPIERLLRARVDPALVNLVPAGVSLPPQPRAVLRDPAQSASIAILGNAADVPAYDAVLHALGRLAETWPNLQIFLELHGAYEHEIWRRAERLNLLGLISAIGDASGYRALLTYCDMMVIPEHLLEVRSIVLEGMAIGMPVVVSGAPAMSLLADGETALFASRTSPEQWAQKIGELLLQPQSARALAQRAREAVIRTHLSNDQVATLIRALQRPVAGPAMRVPNSLT